MAEHFKTVLYPDILFVSYSIYYFPSCQYRAADRALSVSYCVKVKCDCWIATSTAFELDLLKYSCYLLLQLCYMVKWQWSRIYFELSRYFTACHLKGPECIS